MTRELHDLRKTNDRYPRTHRRTPIRCLLPRGVRPARNRRRQVDLIPTGLKNGWIS